MSGKLMTRKALTSSRKGWTAKICGVFPDVIGNLYDPHGNKVRGFNVTAFEEGNDAGTFNAYFYVSVGSSGSKIKFRF